MLANCSNWLLLMMTEASNGSWQAIFEALVILGKLPGGGKSFLVVTYQ